MGSADVRVRDEALIGVFGVIANIDEMVAPTHAAQGQEGVTHNDSFEVQQQLR